MLAEHKILYFIDSKEFDGWTPVSEDVESGSLRTTAVRLASLTSH